MGDAKTVLDSGATAPDADKTLEPPPRGGPFERDEAAAAKPHRAEDPPRGDLGHYRLVRLLGRGGMGEVWEAEQQRPHRRVALKLVRADLMSAAMRRRFETEAEALGRLSHDGIARVFEAGIDPASDRPYYAMEYVEGERLDDWVARARPDVGTRLRVLIELCRAVQHAHQKFVVHRDLKPANVVITPEGRPKILDFGLARLTDDGDGASRVTRETQTGQVIGTLAYMSPEQAGGDVSEIDALTDVYALGVVAYELLAGKLPLNLAAVPLAVAVRRIVEDEPSRLSSVDRSLRGDLDTIVAKAMAKDKGVRYASAESLGEDVRRFLEYEPIAARRPGAWYNLRKFARRNKATVAGVAASFAILLAGAATSAGYAVKATRESARSAAAEADAVRQRDEAARQEAVAKETNAFLVGMFDEADPAKAQGRQVTAVEVVERGGRELEGRFADQPLVKAALQDQLGYLLMGLGRAAQAEPLLREAWAARERALGPEHDASLSSSANLAMALEALGRPAEAEPLLRRSFEARVRALGPDHPDTLFCLNNVGYVLNTLGRHAEAVAAYRRVLEARERVLGPDDPETLRSANNLAAELDVMGESAEAEPLLRRTLEARERVLGPSHPNTLDTVAVLTGVLRAQGRPAEAEPLGRRLVEDSERVLGPDHPDTLDSLVTLALVLDAQGRSAEAEPLLRRALEGRDRVLGPDHPATLQSVNGLATTLNRLGRSAEAEPLLRRALEARERTLGPDHPSTLESVNNLGGVLFMSRRAAEAEPLLRRALEARQRLLGPDHPQTLESVNNLGGLLYATGRPAEAEPLFRRAMESQERTLGFDHPATLRAANNLASLLRAMGRADEAEPLFRRALEGRERALGPDHPETLVSVNNLAGVLSVVGRPGEAEPLHRRAVESAAANASLGPRHRDTLAYATNYAACLDALDRSDEAAAVRARFALAPPSSRPATRTAAR